MLATNKSKDDYEGIIWPRTDIFDRQGTATRDWRHNSEEKFRRLQEWRNGRLDILKWGSLLEVELRVASHKHGEKSQSNFAVSICTAGKRDEAQREAGTGHRGQKVTFLISLQ